MSPKVQYTKQSIIDSAFMIAKEEGIDGITIRKVASMIGGSVAPVYVNFKDINELKEAVIQKIFQLSREFYLKNQTGRPFFDIGLASIKFAKEYSVIFKDLVMKYNDYMKYYDSEGLFLIEEMKKDPVLAGFSLEELKDILIKMRVFQLGLSVMASNNLLPHEYTEEKTIELLNNAASDIIYAVRNQRKDRT